MTFIDYRSKETPPVGPGAIVQPVPLMPMPELDTGAVKIGEAIQKAGLTMEKVGAELFEAQDRTKAAESLSAFQLEAAALEQGKRYENPTLGDKANVSQELASMRQRHLGGILEPARRAAVEHQMTITSIGIEKRMQQKAIGGMKDSASAALHVQVTQGLKDWSAAETDGQRDGIAKSVVKSIQDAAPTIGANRAITLIENFNKMTSSADATRLMRENPELGKKMMQEGKFPGIINPSEREQWITHFDNREVELKYDRVRQQAIAETPDAARASLDDYSFTPNQRIHANQVIDQVEKQGMALIKAEAAATASLARDENHVRELIKQGTELDARGDLAQYESTQRLAAQMGNTAAMRELQRIDLWKTIGPDIKQAKKLGPEGLDQVIAESDQSMQRRIAAGETIPTAEIARSTALKAVRSTMLEGRQKEPVSLGGIYGAKIYTEKPIDFKNALNDRMQWDLMAERGRQAETANAIWGGSASGFLQQEAIAEKDRYEKAGPLERYQTLDVIAKTFPRKIAIASMQQIAGEQFGNEAFLNLTISQPEIAKKAVAGSLIRADRNFQDFEKEGREEMQKQMPRQLYVDPRDNAAAENLILSVSAVDRGREGQFSRGAVTNAINAVAGEIIKLNGKDVPITPAVPFLGSGTFRDAFAKFNAEDWALAGGIYLDGGRRATPKEIAANATLQSTGPGSPFYHVGRLDAAGEFQPFKDASGSSVRINMPDYVRRHQTHPYVEPGTRAPNPVSPPRAGGPTPLLQRAAPEEGRGLEGDAAIRAELARQFPNETEEQLAARFETMFAQHEGERQLTGAAAIAAITGPIGAVVNPSAWDAAYAGWPASQNIEDRRGEPAIGALEAPRRRSGRQ